MDKNNVNTQIGVATKWSAVTELVSKLVVPIVNMVLARILTPEAFGIVATLTMVISFAEIFTDAGFQKYIIQHEFVDEQDRDERINVAFWSNLFMSLLIWLIISIFSDSLAAIVGNPGLGYVLIIACSSISLGAFSSIQTAIYKRDFDFKTLFKVRVVGILVPIVVTLPLAFLLRSYWALVIGTIVQNLINAVLLTWFSKWKPRPFFSMKKLKDMLSFTIWSVVEQVSIWLTGYVDVFIVGTMLSQYYLGLYKTSSMLVGQIMGLITAATTPVLFSALSRLQNNKDDFLNIFFRFQKMVALLIVPLGVGIFIFSDFVTNLVLGNQWLEASGFIGLWGLTSSITIVLSHYSSEVYRAKGMPKLSVLAQWLHIIALWPTVIFSVRYGFEVLYISRSVVRMESIMVNLMIMYFALKMPVLKMIMNILPCCLAACVMAVVALIIPIGNDILSQITLIILCIFVYICIIMCFKNERNIIKNFRVYLRNV